MSSLLARALVFGSSAAVLVLEILSGRLMAPYLGVSLETFTGIIGTVLMAIAAGSWVGGRAADRTAPRALLAPALVLSGVLVLAAPTIVDTLGPLLRRAGPLEIVALTASAFFLPSLTLSTVPPIVVKLRLSALAEAGTVVGTLSALSTFGALAGTFFTGFVLVAAAPTRPLLLALGVVLVAAGVAMSAGDRRRRTTGLALLAVLVAAVSLGTADSPCGVETRYFCAVIRADPNRPSGRTLQLDTLRHSYVDLGDPTHLEFRYAKTMADVLARQPNGPLRAAYIGGGGFTLPRYVAAVRPGSTATVFEIDGPLVDLVRRELGLVTTDALRVELGDARLRLPAHAASSFDLVVGDAFGGLSVPWHLTTREFIEEIDRVLTDGGVYVVNLIDYPPLAFARAEVATFEEVFPHVAVIAPASYLEGARGGNFVVVGSRSPIETSEIAAALARRPDTERILTGPATATFTRGARPLTDDFAPVDQLLGTPPR